MFIENAIVAFLNSKIVSTSLAALFTAYFTFVKYSTDPFVVNNKPIHDSIIFSLVLVGLALAFLKTLDEWWRDHNNNKYKGMLEELIVLINSAVKIKAERFKTAITSLKKGKIFEQITKPEEQFKALGAGAVKFLSGALGLKPDEIDITVMACNPQGNWYYLYKQKDQWHHRRASEIVKAENSTAAHCLKTGERVFCPAKSQAKEKKMFLASERDERSGDGSIHCMPLIFAPQEGVSYQYIFSLVTYGKPLCDSSNKKAKDAILYILDEIATRFELELSLYTIKKISEAPVRVSATLTQTQSQTVEAKS